MTELEAKLREMTEKGLLSHLSVYAQWGAHNFPTIFRASCITLHGQGHHESVDVVEAIREALEKAPYEPIKRVQQPAPVVREPARPAKALREETRTTSQGQTSVPNLMDLFKRG